MEKVKLGDIAEFQTGPFGTQMHADEYVAEGVPVINVKNIGYGNIITDELEHITEETKNRLSNNILSYGDLVFGRKGSVDRHAYIDTQYEGWFQGSDCIRVRCVDSVDSLFVSYYLRLESVKKQINHSAVGSTMASLNTDVLKGIELKLPDITVQKRIATDLYQIDSKIALNNRINTELEAMAKTIYDYWFTQFDFPDENGRPYKSSGGKMEWNEELQREIPVGWEVKKLGDFIQYIKSGDWGQEEKKGNYTSKVTCLRGTDIPDVVRGDVIGAPERYILEKNLFKKLCPGDFVIEISGGSPTQSTGRICCITENVLNRFSTAVICTNFCKAIRVKKAENFYWFFITWQKIYDAGILFNYESKTTSLKNLLLEIFLGEYDIINIPEKILIKFQRKCEIIYGLIQKNALENAKLIQFRDWLLPMLMNEQVIIENE